MINGRLSWINLNNTGGGGQGGTSDYNQLANRPIKTLTGTTQNPIKLWKLDTGLYVLNGYVQHTNDLASEAKGLFATVTAGLVNGSYIVSAFIPFWEGQYEYSLDTLSSETYNEHQVVRMLSQYDVLTLDNETEYNPTQDYHPSTKKYVDDMVVNFREELNEMGINEENIESLIAENRRRDIAIQALISMNSDKIVTIEEETHTISMDYSIDNGMVTINSLEGSTLVNVANQKEEIGLSYGQDEIVTYSNEIVTEQDTTVNPILEGNTVVNVANQRNEVIVTKGYDTVENSNHIAVPNTVDEKIRPVVEGNTLVNIWRAEDVANQNFIDGNKIKITTTTAQFFNFFNTNISMIKPDTTYTCIVNVYKNTLDEGDTINIFSDGVDVFDISTQITLDDWLIKSNEIGQFIKVLKTPSEITATLLSRSFVNNRSLAEGRKVELDIQIFEGDLTANPPSGYIEGLKSTFEDGYIPENLLEGLTAKSNTETDLLPYRYYELSVKANTIYTIVCPEVRDGDLTYKYNPHANNGDTTLTYEWISGAARTFNTLSHTKVRVYCEVFNGDTKYTDMSYTILDTWNVGLILLEGDWTSNPPTYEDVMNHRGKYKVEYSVVGKNKFSDKHFDTDEIIEGAKNVIFDYTNKTITVSNISPMNYCSHAIDIDYLKPNTQYTLSVTREVIDGSTSGGADVYYWDNNNNKWTYINAIASSWVDNTIRRYVFNTQNYNKVSIRLYSAFSGENTSLGAVRYSNIQLEEGTEATEYEPYKSCTKTFYLNSPLLEGDTIEDVNGKATHVHRYGKFTLDGTESEWVPGITSNGKFFAELSGKQYLHKPKTDSITDTLPSCPGGAMSFDSQTTNGFSSNLNGEHQYRIYLHGASNLDEVKQWLQDNPTTVVYELASPWYETISSSDIAIDSYANGHLDYNTILPISSTKFVAYPKEMVYLNASTSYTIQFNSNGIGTVDITLGGNKVEGKGIAQGLNQIEIATPSTLVDNMLIIEGDNIGISELIVVPLNSANPIYGYFEGIQSCFEEQLVKNEDSPYYGKYRVEYRSDIDVKTVYLNSPLLIGDKIEEVDGKLYHWHKMGMITLNGSNVAKSITENSNIFRWRIYQNSNINNADAYGIWTMNNRYPDVSANFTWGLNGVYKEGICQNSVSNIILLYLERYSDGSDISLNALKNELNENPITVVYTLAEPYYEEILPSQTLVRTSVNGKLSFDSDIPLGSIQLKPYEEELTYLYTSTVYTVQFIANNNFNANITLGGTVLKNATITVGLNRIQITTPSTLVDNKLRIDILGNGKISELVVTNSTKEFGYFESMKSTFEDTVGEEGYNAEVVIYNAPIRFGKGGRL